MRQWVRISHMEPSPMLLPYVIGRVEARACGRSLRGCPTEGLRECPWKKVHESVWEA